MRKIITLTVLVTIVAAGMLFALKRNISSVTVGTTQYILVKDAEMMGSGILKPNAALLITDKKEIQNDEKLFLGNRAIQHACGYHYEIQFWKDEDSLIDNVPFNEECEQFMDYDAAIQSKMKGYIKLLETKPTHYIYNLKIPVSVDPDSVKKCFANSNLQIFFLNGKSEHLESLKFSYMQISQLKAAKDKNKWGEEQEANRKLAYDKIDSMIQSVNKIVSIRAQSRIEDEMSGFSITIENQVGVTLKFDNGTDLAKVKELIISMGGKIESENNPNYYFVQVVDKSETVEKLRIKMGNFPFIRNIYEYPKTE